MIKRAETREEFIELNWRLWEEWPGGPDRTSEHCRRLAGSLWDEDPEKWLPFKEIQLAHRFLDTNLSHLTKEELVKLEQVIDYHLEKGLHL